MKKEFKIVAVSLVVFAATFGAASAGMIIPSADKAKENAKAPEHSPVIYENWDLDRVDFIHYAKPDNVGGGKPKGGGDSCYKLMGVKWNNAPVNYAINPTNSEGLNEAFVLAAAQNSFEAWDDAASVELINDNYSIDYDAQYGVQNFENAIVFGSYPDNGVIGVTSVWYTRKGRQIVEFDMLLNSSFEWGDAVADPAKMDLENIITHEAGHALGLADIYSGSCAGVTMYGYSTEGETSKRTLEQADIDGLQAMYGI